MLCHVMLCYVMLCCAVLCYANAMLCYVMACYTILIGCPTVSRGAGPADPSFGAVCSKLDIDSRLASPRKTMATIELSPHKKQKAVPGVKRVEDLDPDDPSDLILLKKEMKALLKKDLDLYTVFNWGAPVKRLIPPVEDALKHSGVFLGSHL